MASIGFLIGGALVNALAGNWDYWPIKSIVDQWRW